MNFISSQAFRYSVSVIFLCLLSVVNSFAQSASEWQDISLTGADGFSIDAEYRYKISSQTGSWLYAKEVSARNLVTNESYFGQIFYVSADNKKSYQYNGNFLDTVVQIQKRTLPTWTDVVLNNTDPFNTAYEYRFKMTVPGRPGVPAGDFWYYAKQVGAQSLVMDNGYGEITFVSAANKTAYLAQGTPTGITISKMERRALTWNDVPLDTTDAYDVSCEYRFKMNYQASPQWRPGVPAGDFWHYPERASAQSLIANANGGYQTFSVFANNKRVFDFNGVNNNTVLQMQKLCNVPVSTCGNPRAQINFVPYDGIPAADQNSSTNAWDSITLGNKAVVAGGTFFDLTDGTNAIDDGTIVSTGLQNFAVSRHNGYIEFLALGRRLSTYYGYYQGTIKFENVQVDRVEPGLTTATWADVGLEATEGDLVTKVSDNEISFKLAFANQGDGFRVYLKSPTPTECACSAGQEKRSDPKSPVCIVRALVKGVQDTQFILTGYNHLVGNCTLAAGTPQAPQTPSTEIIVTAGQQRTSWMQGSPWTFQLDPLLTCPANTTKTACMFTYGAGPLGEITCGCYPNENTNNPKNLSCRTFTDPLINNLPVFARDASPAQFCREQGYSQSATVGTEYDYLGNGSLWNGTVWEINNHLAAIREVSCCKLEDKTSNICVDAGCAEGQYWCQTENICKPAGQTCNKNDTVGTTVNWVGYSAHTASTATGSIQVGGKTIQANYTGDIAGFGITGESQWNVANGNPTLFPNGIADNVPDQSNIIWNSGGTQTINKITFSEPVINPVMVIYSLGWNTVEYQFNQPFNLIKNTPDVKKLAGNVLQGTGGYGLIQFQGTFSELSFKNPILEATYTIGTAGFNFGVFPVSTVPSVTCNNNNTCEAGESCNCGDCTNGGADDADKCGLSNNAQMLCTKDVKNATTSLTPTTQKWVAYTYPGYASSYIYISKLPTETHTVAGQTFYVYNPERVIRGMSEATFMANPEEAIKNAPVVPVGNTRWTERLIFNLAQLESEAATTQTATLNALTSSVAHRYMCTENVVGATNCSNNSNMGWTPGFGKSQGGDIYVSASNSGGGVAFAKGQILGTFDVTDSTCQLHTTSSLRYVPNTDPRTQGWLNINGIGTAQNDGGKSVWQVNDGGNDSGDNAVVYKKFTTTELNDFFTRGGKYSVELKNISASAPTSGAAYLLASYLEIARGANTTKGARRFTFVFGLDADKTPTIIGLTNNGTTYIAPSNSTYKYRVDGGANKYNTYEMLYDPATDTVDMFVNGVERISNFPGNTVAPGYATAIRDTAAIIFGSGTSPGVANTNYGNISVVIKNNCSGSTVQVGACCPAGAQWDSSQGKCALEAVPGCAEGEYYCHAELKCKAAGESCGTVTCNNNNVCDANESCDCADCNEKVDHCGLSGSGEQLICTKDTAEKCYTDKFPYCLSACLDGYKMDTNGQCMPVAPVGVPQTCTVRSVQGIEGSVALCNAGEVRVGGGCENTNGGAYRFFTFPLVKGETWWNYTNVAENGWACGSGSTGTYTKAYAICCSAPTTGTYEIRKGAPGIGSKLSVSHEKSVQVADVKI